MASFTPRDFASPWVTMSGVPMLTGVAMAEALVKDVIDEARDRRGAHRLAGREFRPRRALAGAVTWHAERRILLNGRRTVVFA